MSEECHNPLCKALLGPRLRKPKRFCNSQCRLDAWVLARAAKLLFKLDPLELWKLVHSVAKTMATVSTPAQEESQAAIKRGNR